MNQIFVCPNGAKYFHFGQVHVDCFHCGEAMQPVGVNEFKAMHPDFIQALQLKSEEPVIDIFNEPVLEFEWTDDLVALCAREIYETRKDSEVWTSDLTAELSHINKFRKYRTIYNFVVNNLVNEVELANKLKSLEDEAINHLVDETISVKVPNLMEFIHKVAEKL